jgi:hypothetical protein
MLVSGRTYINTNSPLQLSSTFPKVLALIVTLQNDQNGFQDTQTLQDG